MKILRLWISRSSSPAWKENIDLNFYEDGFYIVAKKEGTKYMGSYALILPVQPEKAIAKYANGLLAVNIPYKEPFEKGLKVKIDKLLSPKLLNSKSKFVQLAVT